MEHADATNERYRRALDSVVEQLKRDPYVLAAILVGSLSYDTVWERSDIDLFVVTDEAKIKNEALTLVEDDIIVHAYPQTRSAFRKAVQGAIRSSFLDSILSRGTVLFSRDETIPRLLADQGALGASDQAAQVLQRAACILPLLTKAQKYYHAKSDLHYAFLWIMSLLPGLAGVETLRHGEVTGREVIQQAERHNPELFNALYHDLIDGPKTVETIGAALNLVHGYLVQNLNEIFGPLLDYLAEQPGARSATEIDHHFASHFNIESASMACEWLADEGFIDRVAVPTRITERSRADVQEAAYYFLREFGRSIGRFQMRSTIQIVGARVHNLKNVSLEIPRDQLVIITGVSGSGKSSLAFDTVYAEGQRRYMESLSSFSKRFVEQVARPDVDFVYGLSPVISIEQKTIGRSPRSTVGTLTDIASYLNLLFSTIGEACCPRCKSGVPIRSVRQIAERLLALPDGTTVELHAPIFPFYGEDLDYLYTDIRKKGVRHVTVDGVVTDLSDRALPAGDAASGEEAPEADAGQAPDAAYDAIVDRLVVRRQAEKSLLAAIENAVQIGERFLRLFVVQPDGTRVLLDDLGCPTHGYVLAAPGSADFMFNNPTAACRTCLGLGTYRQVHPKLLVPDPRRSIAAGCFVPEAFRYSRDTWDGAAMYSLSQLLELQSGYAVCELPPEIVQMLFYGLPERITHPGPAGQQVQPQVSGSRISLGWHGAAHRAPLPALSASSRSRTRIWRTICRR